MKLSISLSIFGGEFVFGFFVRSGQKIRTPEKKLVNALAGPPRARRLRRHPGGPGRRHARRLHGDVRGDPGRREDAAGQEDGPVQELLQQRLRFSLDLFPVSFDPGQAPLRRLPGAQGCALAALLRAPDREVDALPSVRGEGPTGVPQLLGERASRRDGRGGRCGKGEGEGEGEGEGGGSGGGRGSRSAVEEKFFSVALSFLSLSIYIFCRSG